MERTRQGIVNLRNAKSSAANALAEGSRHATSLLELPPSSWRRKMREVAAYRSYGTLRHILQVARDKFQTEPSVALQITSVTLEFVDRISDAPSHVHLQGIRGLARKEHANALRITGDLRQALKCARASVEIYSECGALEFDAAKSKLVSAQILDEMGDSDAAVALVNECIVKFEEYSESTYRIMARMTLGNIQFRRKQFKQALSIFRDVVEQAEREENIHMLARGLHNAAEAARELGDIQAAREIYPRVIKYMTTLGLTTDLPRVTWGYALTLVAEGKLGTAISEIYKVRNLYLHLGMNLDAATAELEIVRIKLQLGEDVVDYCSQLVETFARAGAAQNALEAFAYLREQAAAGQLTLAKIESVRIFAAELPKKPNLRFVRPESHE